MKSFGQSSESQAETPTPFAAEGGLARMPADESDPLARLDELIAVVEALCPEPPERPPFSADDCIPVVKLRAAMVREGVAGPLTGQTVHLRVQRYRLHNLEPLKFNVSIIADSERFTAEAK